MEDDKGQRVPVWREGLVWAGCIAAAVMPTAILLAVVQAFEGQSEPWFAPGLFIGVFTLMVLAVRPWTWR